MPNEDFCLCGYNFFVVIEFVAETSYAPGPGVVSLIYSIESSSESLSPTVVEGGAFYDSILLYAGF